MSMFCAPAWMIKGAAGSGGGAARAYAAAGGDVPGANSPYHHITGYGTGNTINLPRTSYNGYRVVINDDNGYYYTFERTLHTGNMWKKGNKVEK